MDGLMNGMRKVYYDDGEKIIDNWRAKLSFIKLLYSLTEPKWLNVLVDKLCFFYSHLCMHAYFSIKSSHIRNNLNKSIKINFISYPYAYFVRRTF